MTYYLIVTKDTHADDGYQVRKELEDALAVASAEVMQSCSYYNMGQEDIDRVPCDGSHGFHFSENSACGSFSIHVREIEVPE